MIFVNSADTALLFVIHWTWHVYNKT